MRRSILLLAAVALLVGGAIPAQGNSAGSNRAVVETLYGDGSIGCPDHWADDLSKPLGIVVFRPTSDGASFTVVLNDAAPNEEYKIGVNLEDGSCAVGIDMFHGLTTNSQGAGVIHGSTELEPGVYSIQVNIVTEDHTLPPGSDPRDREIGQSGFAQITIP